MNKNELKKMLRPLIKECIREVIFEEGMLSGIVTEVATGLNSASGRQIIETRAPLTPSAEDQEQTAVIRKKKLNETRRKMLDAIGNDSYNGVNLFENTEPMHSAGQEGAGSTQGPLSGIDPKDPGVDISSFFGGNTRKYR